ncbi:hypothetical protein BDK88_3749 [Natrinema hispanicum]|nr:hypothetical protein BDK88_3525 [Natrinema hispanicum]RZV06718.1 hypothetical protein BDK88_3749 [Natrinema hispanicum]
MGLLEILMYLWALAIIIGSVYTFVQMILGKSSVGNFF